MPLLTLRNREHPFRLFFPLACLGAWVALLPWLALLLAPHTPLIRCTGTRLPS